MASISAETWSVGAHGRRRTRRIMGGQNMFREGIYVVGRPNATIHFFMDGDSFWAGKRFNDMPDSHLSIELPRKYAASLMLAVIKSGRK